VVNARKTPNGSSDKGRGERKEDAQGIKENGKAGKIMVGQERIKLFLLCYGKKKNKIVTRKFLQ